MHSLIATTLCLQIFGPVISVAKFTTEEEAIELANNSIYGLAAAVFTNDAKQSMRVSGALEAGTVWVNSYALLQVQAPFGGFKQSGIGRGESREIKFWLGPGPDTTIPRLRIGNLRSRGIHSGQGCSPQPRRDHGLALLSDGGGGAREL